MKKPKKSEVNAMVESASALIFEAVINKRDAEWHRRASQWWMNYAGVVKGNSKK